MGFLFLFFLCFMRNHGGHELTRLRGSGPAPPYAGKQSHTRVDVNHFYVSWGHDSWRNVMGLLRRASQTRLSEGSSSNFIRACDAFGPAPTNAGKQSFIFFNTIS